jgi:hypothetical protein
VLKRREKIEKENIQTTLIERKKKGEMEFEEENAPMKSNVDKEYNFKKRGLRLMSALFLVTPFFIVFGMTIDIWNISHSPKFHSNVHGNFSFSAESC